MKLFLSLLMLAPFCAWAQVTNDEPCTAISLPVLQGPGSCQQTAFSMTNATYNAAFNNVTCPAMNPTPSDVWFRFAVPASGSFRVFTSAMPGSTDNDGLMYVYYTSNCNSVFTQSSCNDDPPGGLMPAVELNGFTPGDSIYVRFMQYNGGTNGTFNICITDPRAPLSAQKVGIGLSAPDSTLDVNGNTVIRGGARVANGLTVDGPLTVKSGTPGAGKVLTSSANGTASWQDVVSNVGAGAINQTLRHNGTGWVTNGALLNDGNTVTVSGNLKITSGAPGANKILGSDATGNAAWKTGPSSLYAMTNVAQPLQLIGQSTYDKSISFNVETFDDLGQFNDSIFTALTAGTYLVNLNVTLYKTSGTLTVPERIEMRIVPQQGGTYRYASGFYPPAFTAPVTLHYNGVYRLNAGNTLKVQVAKETNAASFSLYTYDTNISITRLF